MSSNTAEPTRRLFLALWPDDAVRLRLVQVAEQVAGRRAVKGHNLHLTLVFLGATTASRQNCYEAALADLQVPTLTLRLDRLGYFPKPRVLWLGSSQVVPALHALVADINRRLLTCGFTLESRPFSPHITLARKYHGPVPALADADAILWTTRQISLIQSVSQTAGVRYQVLRGWPGRDP